MNFLSRELICDKLRLSKRQSYSIIGSSRGSCISSDDVLALLNRARRTIEAPFEYIPQLMTADEMADMLDGSGITAHNLLVWTRRTKDVAPHIRLNKQTTRFSPTAMVSWLESRSHITSRS